MKADGQALGVAAGRTMCAARCGRAACRSAGFRTSSSSRPATLMGLHGSSSRPGAWRTTGTRVRTRMSDGSFVCSNTVCENSHVLMSCGQTMQGRCSNPVPHKICCPVCKANDTLSKLNIWKAEICHVAIQILQQHCQLKTKPLKRGLLACHINGHQSSINLTSLFPAWYCFFQFKPFKSQSV